MPPYETPAALRAALDARLASRSRETNTDPERLRRRAVFERLLVRLILVEPDQWILKGGMALEVRLGDKARATKDLDLALRDAGADGNAVRERLIDCLGHDPEEDWFEFLVGVPAEISPDQAGRPGWRFSVESRLGGKTFARVVVEVVARAEEISKTVHVSLPGVLDFAGIGPREVEVVDPAQHFAEKVHALTRSYGDRPNSRVRDLVDLVLLIDDGLAPTDELLGIVDHVFRERATHDVPPELPDPPAFWRDDYPARAEPLDVSAQTLDDAMALTRRFWAELLKHRDQED